MISKRTLTIGVLVLALVAGAAAFSGAAAAAAPAFAQEDDNETSDGTDGEATISIEDQETDGNTVVVDSATLPDGGFLVVYNDQQEFVGVSEFLEAGSHENVTVELDEQLTYDQVVLVEAYRGDENDEFDEEAFTSDEEETETDDENATEEPPANEPYIGDEDEEAEEKFTVSATAFITVTGDADGEETPTEDGEGTPTESGEETPTEDGEGTPTEDGADDGIPGFGAVLAVVALVAAALLAGRRTN